MQPILERLKETPLVLDGAMGTIIYAKGVFINTCYDEICLSNPKLVLEVHEEYIQAGADAIETNTFGANRMKLARYGLGDKVGDINRAAVRLARQAAGDEVYVLGSVGPCLQPGQALSDESSEELAGIYEEQIQALTSEGVDLILLETFSNLDELRLAASVAGKFDTPVFGSVTVDEKGDSILGRKIEDLISALDADDNLDGLGINCSTGPAPAYDILKRALPLTAKPFLAMPNAGMPREIDGRMIYMSNPEYFTEYAKKFIELGVRGIGGCCGTTPDHIRMAARTVKNLSGVKKYIEVHSYAPEEIEVETIPGAEKSRLANKIYRGEKITTVEIVPPRSCDLTVMLEKARKCCFHGVDAINIPDGPRASSRISPMVTAIAVKNEVGIEPVLHYCCRDRNLIGMQADLMGGFAAGLSNFLIITGDPPKMGDYPDATGVFDVDSIGLTRVVRNLNHGRDVGGSPIKPPTGIFIGVGANPCAVELDREIERYHRKIEAGAEYAITQPIFDVEALFRFQDAVGKREPAIPIVAGVWPLMSFKNAEFLKNEVPGVEVPDEILERLRVCETKEDGQKVGVEIAQEVCEAIHSRVAGFQVSAPFGNVDVALKVLGKL